METEEREPYVIKGMAVSVVTIESLMRELSPRVRVEEKSIQKTEIGVSSQNVWNGIVLPSLTYEYLRQAFIEMHNMQWTPGESREVTMSDFNFFALRRMIDHYDKFSKKEVPGTLTTIYEEIYNNKFPSRNKTFKVAGYVLDSKNQTSRQSESEMKILDAVATPPMDGSIDTVERFFQNVSQLLKLSDDEIVNYVNKQLPLASNLFRRTVLDLISNDKSMYPYILLQTINMSKYKQIYLPYKTIEMMLETLLGRNGTYYMLIFSRVAPNAYKKEPVIKGIYMDIFGNTWYGILAESKQWGESVMASFIGRDLLKKIFPLFKDIPVRSVKDISYFNDMKDVAMNMRALGQAVEVKSGRAHEQVVKNLTDNILKNVNTAYEIVDGRTVTGNTIKNILASAPQKPATAKFISLDEKKPLAPASTKRDTFDRKPVNKSKYSNLL